MNASPPGTVSNIRNMGFQTSADTEQDVVYRKREPKKNTPSELLGQSGGRFCRWRSLRFDKVDEDWLSEIAGRTRRFGPESSKPLVSRPRFLNILRRLSDSFAGSAFRLGQHSAANESGQTLSMPAGDEAGRKAVAMQDASAGDAPRRGNDKLAALADRAFDFPCQVAPRKSYIIASTPRAGGAYLCAQLWKTGVLGAPCAYLEYPGGRLGGRMARRLKPSSQADYLAKVIACRTSKNGVFGMKVNFREFRDKLLRNPESLSLLSPVTYIYCDRSNKLAHAVDMARAEQTDSRNSAQRHGAFAPHYDRNMISKYLGSLERGRLGWLRWFETNAIDPLVVTLEELIADKSSVVRSIVELLGVQGDEPEMVRRLPVVEAPGDKITADWAIRFEREVEAGIRLPDV